VAYRAEMLSEILRLKRLTRKASGPGELDRLDKAESSRLVNIPQDQFGRYLDGREPKPPALAKIAHGLELDGNYLLGIRTRFDGMATRQALAHMALDRYMQDRSVDESDTDTLRFLADQHPNPPMWSHEWQVLHTSLLLIRRLQVGGAQLPLRFPNAVSAARSVR
jgi:hypothetical protein